MKSLLIAFFALFSWSFSFAQWNQIRVETSTNDYSLFDFSSCFNDLFRNSGDYIIRYGRGDFYKKHGVKSVEIRDVNGTLQYYCQIDTSGRLIKEGRQLKEVFFEEQTKEISKEEYLQIHTYSQEDGVVRIDSIRGYYREYKNLDTNFYYSVQSRISYWRGSMVNARNRYLNEHYWNEEIQQHEGNLTVLPPALVFNEDGTVDESPVYYSEPFKTDYDSLELYKFEHIRYASGHHHYVGQKKLDPGIIQAHPFFKPSLNQSINEQYVDGASFNEPRFSSQRMWCGNSLNAIHYDNGHRYGYTENEAGLRDTFYVDFYEIDTSKVPEPTPVANTDSANIVFYEPAVLTESYNSQPRRVSMPIRTPKLFFRYTYYARTEE